MNTNKIFGFIIIAIASVLLTDNAKCRWKETVYSILLIVGCYIAWMI